MAWKGAAPEGPKVVSGQVDHFAPDLQRGQSEELAQRGRPDILQSPPEPKKGTLGNIGRLLPALQPPIMAEHLPGQVGKPIGRTGDQLLACLGIPIKQTIQAALQPDGRAVGHGHTFPSVNDRDARSPSGPQDARVKTLGDRLLSSALKCWVHLILTNLQRDRMQSS